MPETGKYTFRKNERLCSLKLTETLFNGGGSHSMVAFPIRLVYTETAPPDGNAPVSLLISVPKKRFKHAVKRNRAKRQMREAYRLNKHILAPASEKLEGKTLSMGFIWLSDELMPTERVEKSMVNLLERLNERITMDK